MSYIFFVKDCRYSVTKQPRPTKASDASSLTFFQAKQSHPLRSNQSRFGSARLFCDLSASVPSFSCSGLSDFACYFACLTPIADVYGMSLNTEVEEAL